MEKLKTLVENLNLKNSIIIGLDKNDLVLISASYSEGFVEKLVSSIIVDQRAFVKTMETISLLRFAVEQASMIADFALQKKDDKVIPNLN